MTLRLILICLSLICTLVQAVEPGAVTSKPPPPRWRQGTPVTVLIGADVSTGLEGQLTATNLILRITDLSRAPMFIIGSAECVIDATAWSNLAAERVMIRPRLLRCFDAQGKELPSRNIGGFAVDKDARIGIKSPLLWSATAKELLLVGVGAPPKPGFLKRTVSNALTTATLGLSDELLKRDDDPKGPAVNPDAMREVRGMESVLPTLTLEPGRDFDVVLNGPPPPERPVVAPPVATPPVEAPKPAAQL